MVKTQKPGKKVYSEEQIEDLLEIQRDMIQERIKYLKEDIVVYPYLSIALAFTLGFALGIALSSKSRK